MASASGQGLNQAGRALDTFTASGGQHVLAAELLLFVGIVGMRAVATYGPGDKRALPKDQYGPLFILGNGFAVFFVLAFLAVRGGAWARVATIAGLIIDVALLLKSTAHLQVIADTYAGPHKYRPVSLEATTPPEALPPALAYEVTNRALPPTPRGRSSSQAMSYAHRLLSRYGWGPGQWGDLVKLWNAESGWNYRATNVSTGAYGIPQALPADKMASAGPDWRTNPFTQIRWGLGYIQDRYGSPSAAWSHEQHFGWY